jgi:AraC-like DNA-binding protein
MAGLALDWIQFVTLLGAIQGVFLAGALASKRSNRTANRLLAAAMLVFSVSLATGVYHALQLERSYPHFFGVGYPLPFLYGPLIYLYAVAAADRNHRLAARDALHFVPFAIVVLLGLPIYLSSGPEKLAFFARLERGDFPLWMVVVDPLKYVSGVGYAAATMVFLLRHRERVKESYSSTERVNLRWLLWLGGAAAAIWALALSFQLVESAGLASVERSDRYVGLAMALLVYAIGYRGLRQPEIFRYETAEYQVPVPPAVAPVAARDEPVAAGAADPGAAIDAPVERYARSGLTGRQAARLRDALTALMDNESPWRDSELTLADLAARLDTTPHKLSEVLNAEIGQSFYDFVNGYRVRDVQRRIAAGEARQAKMLTLAMNAGFASKSTFNLVFKKHTNQTPTDYQRVASG